MLAICLYFIYGLVAVTSLSVGGLKKIYHHNDSSFGLTVDQIFDKNITTNLTHAPTPCDICDEICGQPAACFGYGIKKVFILSGILLGVCAAIFLVTFVIIRIVKRTPKYTEMQFTYKSIPQQQK